MSSRHFGRRSIVWVFVLSAMLVALPADRLALAGPDDQSGGADRDFATAMVSHHQAEIELAQIVMRQGTDPEIRKLAQVVSATHRRQLAFLEAWLAGGATRPLGHTRSQDPMISSIKSCLYLFMLFIPLSVTTPDQNIACRYCVTRIYFDQIKCHLAKITYQIQRHSNSHR